MIRIFTLSTCHNRRAKTLTALRDLHEQKLCSPCDLTHCLVDDASTDGTRQAVNELFPDVTVLQGSGELYWAGGMRFGWENFVKDQEFDYLFVYNDDAAFYPNALQELLDVVPDSMMAEVAVGSFCDPDSGETTYGGHCRSGGAHPLRFGRRLDPTGEVQSADTLNMNGALITRGALASVGFLSEFFIHSAADFEYGLKLRKKGGRVLVAPKYIGEAELNPMSKVTPDRAETFREALTMLFDSKREPFVQRLRLYARHGGMLWPVFWLSPYLTVWLWPIRRFRMRHFEK